MNKRDASPAVSAQHKDFAYYRHLVTRILGERTHELQVGLRNIEDAAHTLDSSTHLTNPVDLTGNQRAHAVRINLLTEKLVTTINSAKANAKDDVLGLLQALYDHRIDKVDIIQKTKLPGQGRRAPSGLGRSDTELGEARITRFVETAWNRRLASIRSELSTKIAALSIFTNEWLTETISPLQDKLREHQSYFIDSLNLVERALLEDYAKDRMRGADAKEIKNIRVESESSFYNEVTPPSEERKEGDVEDATLIAYALARFFDTLGVSGENIDDAALAEAALVVAKRKIAGRPIWDKRKSFENLGHLNAARFVRAVYRDLIEDGPYVVEGRSIWHLLLPGGVPVWQEAVRSHDPKTVQMLYVYINGRGTDLGDAEGLTFAKKVNRPSAKRMKKKPSRELKRFKLG
jgi:hypothetical protein